MKKIILCSLLCGVIGFSCKKDEIEPNDPTPEITGISISPGSVAEFSEEIVFTISYRDANGDLGENNPDAKNLLVIDNRIGIAEEFRIPELAPRGTDISIEGDLTVKLSGTGITDGSASQSFNYTVYLVDRAGLESNRFDTENITVNR